MNIMCLKYFHEPQTAACRKEELQSGARVLKKKVGQWKETATLQTSRNDRKKWKKEKRM